MSTKWLLIILLMLAVVSVTTVVVVYLVLHAGATPAHVALKNAPRAVTAECTDAAEAKRIEAPIVRRIQRFFAPKGLIIPPPPEVCEPTAVEVVPNPKE